MIRENNLLLLLQALVPLGIGVATGEMCQNRVMFKQFLKANAMQYCQIDACRLGGVNEVLAVILLAAKFNGLSWTLNSYYNESWLLSLPVNCNQIQIPGSEISATFVVHQDRILNVVTLHFIREYLSAFFSSCLSPCRGCGIMRISSTSFYV